LAPFPKGKEGKKRRAEEVEIWLLKGSGRGRKF